MSAVVRFDDALAAACKLARKYAERLGPRYLLLRDLYGYIALIVDRPAGPDLEILKGELHNALGGFSPGPDGVLLGHGDIGSLDSLLNDPDSMPADDEEPEIRMVERQLIGSDWWRGPIPEPADPPRLVFYGVKGGVGRSTALAVTAWHLAKAGRRVLVVDMDLESPGVSSLLLPAERTPRFGVVDWLVESAVGQDDRKLIDDMLAPSPLAADSSGEIWVAPAGGRQMASYAAKLARAYLTVSTPNQGELPFAERLDRMVHALVDFKPADVVLLDSRAGLHEIAAATITHLGAQTLLFAVGNEQTFGAYDVLFRELCRSPKKAQYLREGLKLVSALVPSQDRAGYLKGLLDRAYRLFQDNLYDEVPAGEIDGFNFDLEDPAAPHYPLTVFWAPEFTGDFSPVRAGLPGLAAQAQAAFGDLLRGVEDLISE